MEIGTFAEIVKDGVAKQLGDGYHVTVCGINKNNGVVYTGLKVEKEDSSIAPLIYLDDHFKRFESGGAAFSEIIGHAASAGKSKNKNPSVDKRQFLDYENIKGSVIYKLVNMERNRELLEDIPYMEFLDLSIVFQCMVASKSHEAAFMLIHNVHLQLWDVTEEDLFCAAQTNTPRLMGCEFMGMNDLICEMTQAEVSKKFDYDAFKSESKDLVPMYVLSNRYRIDGAACILYTNLLSDICEQLESSFYIIPSSIHEVLILPTKNLEERDPLKNMISEVNNTEVLPEEILSYSLYYYDKEDRQIMEL